MPPLNQEQLKVIQEKAKPIFEHLERKKALEWARQLEKQVAALENADPETFAQCQKLIVQLKWVACPLIKSDREFLNLVENHFLEALELDVNLIDLVTAKFELLFGVGLRKSIVEMLTALRANGQQLGANPIKREKETVLFKPIIKNWLADFLENTEMRNPGATEEADYLFNDQNTKQLSESDRRTLGKILSFYNTFKLYADGLALRERMGQPDTSSPFRPQPVPKKPVSPTPQKPFRVTSRGIYRKPTEESSSQSEPKIEGNVIDLKNQ